MSTELAKSLLRSRNLESFWKSHGGGSGLSTLTALKAEIDRLIRVDLTAASRLADRIEALARIAGDAVSKALATASRARVLHFTGHYSDASHKYERAVKALNTARLPLEAASIQRQQVDALAEMGLYKEALKTARLASRRLAAGEPVQRAQLEANIGNVYYRLDRYKEALEHYDRARSMLPRRGDPTMRALIDLNRAHVLFELDRPDQSLALLTSAEQTYTQAGQTLYAGQARFHIAYIQFLRGNYNTALASYYQTRDHLSNLGSNHLVAWCDQEIAEILLALNSFDDAGESADSARTRFKKLGMPYESAQALQIRGLAALGQRKFFQSRNDLSRARTEFERMNNRNLVALTDSYLAELAVRQGDGARAAKHAESASKVFRRRKLATRLANSLVLSARAAYQLGSGSSALSSARAALRSVEGLFAPRISYQSHHIIGSVHRDSGRHDSALQSFRRAVETVERMRGGIGSEEFKASFLSDKIEVYEDAISACLQGGSRELIEEAFRLVESSKSRSLADLLARYVRSGGRQSGGNQAQHDRLREQLSKLIAKLNWYSSQAGIEDDKGEEQRSAGLAHGYRRAVTRCEQEIGRIFRRLEAQNSAFAEFQMLRPAQASDLRGALNHGETAIEYFATGDQLSAFVVSGNGFTVARNIASNKDVGEALSALRFHLEKFNFGSSYVDAHFWQLKRNTDEHLARLYHLAFAPLETLIGGERLIIIPHGKLHYVPFQALRDDGGYLIDRFEFSYAPSAAVLKLCREQRKGVPGEHMVALGVAETETPGIDDEINALETIFPGAIKLSGGRATQENLMKFAPRARFLHLASHGYFRRDNPMFSFLKLADSNLNFYSLLDLELNAELVTLSACHTGVNLVFPGDELHGLMRGFLYAGAPSLLASLWAVADRSTTEMMSEMYSHIKAGVSKRTALRKAQLTVRAQYGHPYYWAPFVLMGNPD